MARPLLPDPATVAATARTWLFVPGDRPERFERASDSGVDVVILDLEDAVAADHKDAARSHVAARLAGRAAVSAVRVNAVGTPWHDADIAALVTHPALVMLPKAEDPRVVADVLAALPKGSVVVALIETALGVSRASEIAQVEGVRRLVLGTFDLAAELGVDPDHAPALAGPRTALVLGSAIAGLAGPVDGVTGSVRDDDRVTADVTASAALGFTGKLCIHPAQVAPAAAALAPSDVEVAWAERVLDATRSAEHGAVLVDGRMVDAPVIARARRIASTSTSRP